MLDIFITCPTTKRAVKTGINVATREDFEALEFKDNRMNCPECKQEHVWGDEEAYLESEIV